MTDDQVKPSYVIDGVGHFEVSIDDLLGSVGDAIKWLKDVLAEAPDAVFYDSGDVYDGHNYCIKWTRKLTPQEMESARAAAIAAIAKRDKHEREQYRILKAKYGD